MDGRGPLPDLDGVFAAMALDAGDGTAADADASFNSADTNAADNYGANSAGSVPPPLVGDGDMSAAMWSDGDPAAYTEQLYGETGYGDHQWAYGDETGVSLDRQLEALKAYEELEEVQQAADEWISQLPDTIRSSLVGNSDLLEKFAPQATPAMQALGALAPEELEDVCLRLLQRPTAQEIYAEVQAMADAAEYDEDEDAKAKTPCKYFLVGYCKRSKCHYAHDMSAIPCQFYHSQGWCAKGEACIFLHDTHVVRVREALTWLPTLLLTGRVAVLAALRYTEGKGVGDTTSQPTSTAEPAPDLEDADNFPQLVDNGLSLVPLERAEEPLWTGARQIAFRQILNAFCNTLPQQSEVALEDVFVLQNFSLTSTMTQLLHMGKWMLRMRPNKDWVRQEYTRRMLIKRRQAGGGQRLGQPPPTPEIPRLSTGSAVGAEYRRLRGEAMKLAVQRNKRFEQAAELYKRGDGKEARRLADEGQLLDTQMKQMHAQAADALFTSRQEELGAGQARDDVIDLHGLHVAEAIEYIEKIIDQKRPEWLFVITGTGTHSDHAHRGQNRKKAQLLPAIKDWATSAGYGIKEVAADRGGVLRLRCFDADANDETLRARFMTATEETMIQEVFSAARV